MGETAGPGEKELVAIGRITSCWGKRGEVRVTPLTDFPRRFQELERIFLTRGGRREETRVEKVRFQGKRIILKLSCCTCLEEAEKLRGVLISLPREERGELPPLTYYVDDLMGLEVYAKDDTFLGTVCDIIRTGSNDVYVVRGKEELLIPAIREVVEEVDLSRKRMRINLLDGIRPPAEAGGKRRRKKPTGESHED